MSDTELPPPMQYFQDTRGQIYKAETRKNMGDAQLPFVADHIDEFMDKNDAGDLLPTQKALIEDRALHAAMAGTTR